MTVSPSTFRWLDAVAPLAASGLIRPIGPLTAFRIGQAAWQFGPSVATVLAVSAARYGDRTAVIDERGAITYGQLDSRAAAIAAALHSRHPGARSVAILCRNHCGFVEAFAAGAQLGCELIFLNTDLPAAQLALILQRHSPDILVHDEEYDSAVTEAGFPGARIHAWQTTETRDSLDSLARERHPTPPRVRHAVKITLLTSGTTGLAKGVSRPIRQRPLLEMVATAMAATRLTARDVGVLSPPFFHGFGLAMLIGSLALGATVIVRRRFDPDAALSDIDRHRATVFVGVPVMLQRIVSIPDQRRREFRTDSLRLAVTGAAPIAPATIGRFIETFGPILVNGYGSTEAGIVALATTADLAHSPKTTGRPAIGVSVRILRPDRTPAAMGETGAIFVRGGLGYDGYVADSKSPAKAKEIINGYVNTGDMGHLDRAGRLYIDGRDDDMIISGGENIHPKEVEDLLAAHPTIADVAVIAVPSEEFGQVLRAYLVPAPDRTIPTTNELETYIRERLERYKTPKDFVTLTQIPRNPTGKVLRHKLDSHANDIAS
ncbi:AMP-binding protein [Nocardia alni]|uniref:AMP-binding protein n=1 Tax=Nocardia alni TaxID=2815723 RepID=UPI001C213669|nr:AMP-binding protein [Nocardia alni]